MKRLFLLAGVAALVFGFWVSGPAQAAGNATCKINGTAHFTPGLKTAKQSISYTFSGKATNCNSTIKNLKSGAISAHGAGGQVSCTGGATSGSGTISWNTGQVSGFNFTTSGSGPVVKVSGKVNSGAFSGSTVTAVLAFAANPAQCNGAGVTSAPFNGAFRGA